MLFIFTACLGNEKRPAAANGLTSCSASVSSRCEPASALGEVPRATELPLPSPTPTGTPAATPTTESGARAFPGIERGMSIPNPLPPPAFEEGFQNTFYYMAFESDYSPTLPKDQEVLDLKGKLIANVSTPFMNSLKLEGSGELSDGRVVNFAGRVGGESRYHVTRHFWGRAGGDCSLKPLQTIAIDPTFVPQGSTVYIDETVGMKLPDGSLHSGVWFAEDTGSAILKARVDIFVGKKEWAKSLNSAGIKHMQPLTIRVIAPPAAHSCLNDPPK